jgi:hypothetical protein
VAASTALLGLVLRTPTETKMDRAWRDFLMSDLTCHVKLAITLVKPVITCLTIRALHVMRPIVFVSIMKTTIHVFARMDFTRQIKRHVFLAIIVAKLAPMLEEALATPVMNTTTGNYMKILSVNVHLDILTEETLNVS